MLSVFRRRRLDRKALRLARLLCELDDRARDARKPQLRPRSTTVGLRN
jgi:hypothetical protein